MFLRVFVSCHKHCQSVTLPDTFHFLTKLHDVYMKRYHRHMFTLMDMKIASILRQKKMLNLELCIFTFSNTMHVKLV